MIPPGVFKRATAQLGLGLGLRVAQSNRVNKRPGRADFSEWLIGVYLHPPSPHRRVVWSLLGGMVLIVGVADYFTGIEIALTIFFLIPVTLATGWFGWRVGIVFVAASDLARVASDILVVYPGHLPFHTWWRILASTVIFLFIVWLLDSLLALHRALEVKVEERTSQLKEAVAHQERLEREILEVGARERSAIGRELHDELGQHLTATALAAQTLVEQLGDRPEAGRAKSIVRWIEEGTSKARKLARGLLLEHIEPDRLPQELRDLANGAIQSGVRGRFICSGAVTASGAECAQLFRIAQEAVGNALRHAEPHAIDITLASDGQTLCLVVEDDGKGLPQAKGIADGYGLRIMEHRAKMIGGSFALVSAPGEGTKVICRLPRLGRAPA